MKELLGLLLLGGGGYLAFKYFANQQSGGGNSPVVPAGGITAQSRGLTSPQPQPRVDNSNQPWYGGSTAFQGPPQSVQNVANAASLLSNGASIIHSSSDIFGTVSDWGLFGGSDENTYDVAETDFVGPVTWDANDNGMGDLNTDGSSTNYSNNFDFGDVA